MSILIYVVLFSTYACLPILIQCRVFLVDLFVSDPIIFNEVILLIKLSDKIAFVTGFISFITEPKFHYNNYCCIVIRLVIILCQ